MVNCSDSNSKHPLQLELVNYNYRVLVLRAPDGSCLMTNSEDHTIRLFNLPAQFYSTGGGIDFEQIDGEMVCNAMFVINGYSI